MLISTGGVLIRTPVKSIREMSRSTQGVTLINLGDGEKLAGLERVVEPDDDDEARTGGACTGPQRTSLPWPKTSPDSAADAELAATARRSTRSTARSSSGSTRAPRTRRRSASSRPAASPTVPSARRRCSRGCRRDNRGPAVRRGRRRRLPAGDVGVPRARAAAAHRLPRAGRHVLARGGGQALRRSSSRPMPCATIDEVFRAAESGQTDYAVVPVENSTEGAVGRTLDLMCQTPLSICGEVKLRIRQNLLSQRGGARRGDARSIRTRSRSRSACSGSRSTCPACRASRSRATPRRRGSPPAEPGAAAIAGEIAAAIYGLDDARAAHRGRAEQHDALLGARPPAGAAVGQATRRRS